MTIIKSALSKVQGWIEFGMIYLWLLSFAYWLDSFGQAEGCKGAKSYGDYQGNRMGYRQRIRI